MIPGVIQKIGGGVLKCGGEVEILGEWWGKDVLLPSRVLGELGGVVETEHVALRWVDVKDGSIEPLPVVIREAVWCGCRRHALGVKPGIVVIPSGDAAMLIVTPV